MRTFIGAAQTTGQLISFEPKLPYEGRVLRYCPDGLYNDGNTMPVFLVYGSEGFTEASAQAALQQGGFAELAADANASVLFLSPVEEHWGPKDRELYLALVSGLDHNYGGENGLKDAVNFMTRQPEGKKLLGNEGLVYLLGEGSGADFIAEYLLGEGLSVRTFFGMEQSFAPTAVLLCNSVAQPRLSSQGVPAYLVNGSPAQAAAFSSSLAHEREDTRLVVQAVSPVTDGFDPAQVLAAWQQVFFRVRRQDNGAGAELYPIPDYRGFELIEERVALSTGPIRALIFLPETLDRSKAWPMVFGFHGGGNSGLFHAWSSELPLLGAEEGFITVEVDQHVERRPAEIVELLDALLAKYPCIDPGKVYCTGFSMGSIKSWGCGLGFTTRFAGIAPMDASGHVVDEQLESFDEVPVEYVHPIPTFYVAGERDGLPVGPNQKGMDGQIYQGCNYLMDGLFRKNGTGRYVFDETGDAYWGLHARTEDLPDGRYTAHAHYVSNPDGSEYCAFCNVENQTHAQIAVSCRQAWAFLRKFRRLPDGSLCIEG